MGRERQSQHQVAEAIRKEAQVKNFHESEVQSAVRETGESYR